MSKKRLSRYFILDIFSKTTKNELKTKKCEVKLSERETEVLDLIAKGYTNKEIAKELDEKDITGKTRDLSVKIDGYAQTLLPKPEIEGQITLFETNTKQEEIMEAIKELNIVCMTPLEALNKLYEWQEKLKKK